MNSSSSVLLLLLWLHLGILGKEEIADGLCGNGQGRSQRHHFHFMSPPIAVARDVPLHHKLSVLNAAAVDHHPTTPESPRRNNSEDTAYYDYDAMADDLSASDAPSDVVYPNPDSLPRKKAAAKTSGSLAGGEAQEITSSNFVLHATGSGNGAPAPLNNNRVLATSNQAVDYQVIEPLDQDFRGHDLIDSIMYIYHYGSHSGSALGKEVGGNIIVIGAVVALAAQLLTIVILLMKHRHSRQKNALFPVLMSLLTTTFLANFFFIVGVQATGNVVQCELVALLLHYLHLSTTFWVFLYIFCVHEFIRNNVGPNLNLLLTLGASMPAVYILFTYLMSTSNYEMANYCWMSVKKGMIFNYMIPISCFIVVTAVYGTMCLRLLRIKQRQQFTESIESFIEHSRSEQMLNQIRQLGPEYPQQAPQQVGQLNTTAMAHGGSHRKLARCHSNPSSTALKKSTAHLRAAANLTTSSINLSSPSACIGSPSRDAQAMHPPPPCCSAMLLQQSHPTAAVHQPPHPPEMMCTNKSLCGDSKYSLGSISLANLSIQSLSSEAEDFEDYKSAVKFAILFQIMFSICWFLAVIALEYPTSMMPIIYVIVLNVVFWIVLAKCQSICPPMVVSPLTAVTATESFSKKSVRSQRSNAADHHHHQQQHALERHCSEKADRRDRRDSVRTNRGEQQQQGEVEKPLAIPFDDAPVGSGGGVKGGSSLKKKDSVDTIPLLAKSAGLRTDPNATIIDNNLDGGAVESVAENGIEEHSPVVTVPEGKLPNSQANGHAAVGVGGTMWKKQNVLDVHRTEFISTIST